jgi:hypothetical protein
MAGDLLRDARVYLSGPMDYLGGSQKTEAEHGWRKRVADVLEEYGATVFNPWHKPHVRGVGEYGREGEQGQTYRERWTFEPGASAAKERATCSQQAWPMMHIDLRMVDTCDFVIAFCPTNVYSVGTVHEIVIARQQKKPVLFVTPPIRLPALHELREQLRGNEEALRSLDHLVETASLKENPAGLPSSWYMALLDSESFFDGFGFQFGDYPGRFQWRTTHFDSLELKDTPKRPLLPFLDELAAGKFPQKWDERGPRRNDDWMLWELESVGRGSELRAVNTAPED